MNKSEILQLISDYQQNYTNKELTLLFVRAYDDFWSKKNLIGQVTASCWVVNKVKTKALLTHHLKLNNWFQLGGHIEESDRNIIEACSRELQEESGLTQFKLLSPSIFDIDVHKIPHSKKGVPEHFHFDLRLLFEANDEEPINFNVLESITVEWKTFEEIKKLTFNLSILRMIEKTRELKPFT